jgi:hypothetical protein
MSRCGLLVIASALAFAGGAQGRGTTTISIAVTTSNQPLGGLTYTAYGSPATVTGTVDGAQPGTAVLLQVNTFPFTGNWATAGEAATAGGGAYTFSAKPSLATQYRVALASDPTSMSATATVYVTPRETAINPPCTRHVSFCTLHLGAELFYPPTTAAREGAKLQYAYLGVGYGSPSGHAARITLRETAHQQRVGPDHFRVRVAMSFATPGAAYHYNWVICARDTETADGLGLPGHHHCGDRTIPYPLYNGWVG